ncbi:MAG: heavy-metal-associated domain-containing protein [Actinomycetota bacterium]
MSTLSAAAKASRPTVPAKRPVKARIAARKPTRRPPASSAAAKKRLPSGAEAPRGGDTNEKAALEIPDVRTPQHASDVILALQHLPGVRSAVIDLNTHLAVVDFDPSATELDHFILACKDAGFEATEYRVEARFPKPIKLKGG